MPSDGTSSDVLPDAGAKPTLKPTLKPIGRKGSQPSTWLAILGLTAVTVLVYLNSLGGVFFFDDANAIESNPFLRGLWPPTRFLSAPDESPANGRPLASFTFALSYAAGGLDPFTFRVGNLAVHAAAAVALFLALRAAFELSGMPLFVRESSFGLAFTVAAIWAVHPLQTECVNYVSQRTESLMGLFFFLCVHAAIRAHRSPRFGVLAFLWCLAGMLSKEIMLAAPPLIFLFDRTFVQGSFAGAFKERWRLYLALGSTALVVLWLMTTRPRSETVGLGLGLSAWDWALSQAEMLRIYLGLLFWPATLAADYGMPRPMTFDEVRFDALLVWSLALLTVFAAWKRPKLAFPLAWFFVVLAPTSSVIPIVTEVGAERRVYAATAPLIALVVVAVWRVIQTVSSARSKRWAASLAVLVLLGLSARTFVRNRDFRSDVLVWSSAVAATPDNARAQVNLAYALHGEERLDEAVLHYDEALRLRRSALDGRHRANANFNVGLIHLERRQFKRAAQRFRRALETSPKFAEASDGLGTALAELKRFDEAADAFRAALAADPKFAGAALRLGMCLEELGDADGARQAFQSVVRIAPNSGAAAEARRRLAR